MKKIKPILAMNQPLLWRQAISQSKFGKINWRNFYCYPLTKWLFSYKNHESYLFDEIIVGANPILTMLLLLKLSHKAQNCGTKIKVGIYFTGNDYWGYHVFEEQNTWEVLAKKTNIFLGKSFFDFCHLHGRNLNHFLDITWIETQNNSIAYYNKDEQYSKGYIFHLNKITYTPNSFEVAMPHVNISENTIRLKYTEILYNFLDNLSHQKIKKLYYSDTMQSHSDTKEQTHLLLSKEVNITSLAYWLNSNSTTIFRKNEDQEQYSATQLVHSFNHCSYGSANETANDFFSLEYQTIHDFISLLS